MPVHDDRVLFEFLGLEGAQAGLSRSTILSNRTSGHAPGNQKGTPLASVAKNITLFYTLTVQPVSIYGRAERMRSSMAAQ